jgi:hypothetical protein
MNAKELESYKASRGIRKALIDVAIEYQNNYLTPEMIKLLTNIYICMYIYIFIYYFINS